MRHVFVETNWVVEYAAPSPFREPGARELLNWAHAGELFLHLPAICLMEAQPALRRQHEPRARATGDAVRHFLRWSRPGIAISSQEENAVLKALDQFESQIRSEREALTEFLDRPHHERNLETFALNSAMLERAVALSTQNLNLEPFDLSVLAATSERSGELLQQGENDLAFCELDTDLQPWDKAGNPKQPLTGLLRLSTRLGL